MASQLALLLVLASLLGSVTSDLINKVSNDRCELPSYSEYFYDEHPVGSLCRLNTSYSTLNIFYLFETTNLRLYNEQNLAMLSNSLVLHGDFSAPDRNQAAFIAFDEMATIKYHFNESKDVNQIKDHVKSVSSWQPVSVPFRFVNYTAAMELALNNIPPGGDRQTIFVFVGNYLPGYPDLDAPSAINFAEAIKITRNIRIISVGIPTLNGIVNEVPLVSRLSTEGWFYNISSNPGQIDSNLYKFFSDKVRQSSCSCPSFTIQFYNRLPSQYPSLQGEKVITYYADCQFLDDMFTDRWDRHAAPCVIYTGSYARYVVLNSTEKWEFAKTNFFNGQSSLRHNVFYTGKFGDLWMGYGSLLPTMPITYQPSESYNATLCNATVETGWQEYAVILADSRTYCPYTSDILAASFCEVKAIDSLDSRRICPSEDFITADPRPDEIGAQCSNSIFSLWLDVYIIAETGLSVTSAQLKALSSNLNATFAGLNFAATGPYTTRFTLITYGTLANVRYSYDSFKSAAALQKGLDLTKYSNKFDLGKNLQLALTTAKLMLLKQSNRRPLVIIASSGVESTPALSTTIDIMRNEFNAAVVTISTNKAIDLPVLPGYSLALNSELGSFLPLLVTQSNCFCPPGYKQFTLTVQGKTLFFANCFRFNPAFATRDQAETICQKDRSRLVSLTSHEKLGYVLDNVLGKVPAFFAGLKRSTLNPNELVWNDLSGNPFVLGRFPKKLDSLNFDSFAQNCTYMAKVNDREALMVPSDCNTDQLQSICEKRAYDSSHYGF